MNMQRMIHLQLAGAIALALLGTAAVATAQTPTGQSTQVYPGTRSSAVFPIKNGTLTVVSGMPAHVKNYGPPPAFKTLDANHNGRISEPEAQAYPPLDSDFLYASGGRGSISPAQYAKWVKTQW